MRKLYNIFKPEKIELSNGKVVQPPKSNMPYILFVLFIVVTLSAKVTNFKLSILLNRGNQFFIILGEMFPPNFSYASEIVLPLVETIKMSLLGSIVGSIIAIPFAIGASVNVNHIKPLLLIIRLFLSIIRTLPTLIIALIATYIFDLGAFAGTVAIALFTLGLVAKMIYEKIETVDMGSFEAMEAVGASKIKAFIGSIMPQILPSYFSISLYSFEINVRYAAILGYVGAGGIGLILNEKIGWREYDKVGMILVMLFITVVLIEFLSKYIREKIG